MLKSINPFSGIVNAEFEEETSSVVKQKLKKSAHAFSKWETVSFEERAKRMKKLAEILLKEKGKHAQLITEEMGKLIGESRAEIEKCAWVCKFYAENAEKMLAKEFVSTHPTVSQIHYETLGTVLGVMPWNFPYWQVFRFAAPSIMAGNVCALKHASNVPLCSLEIEKLFLRAGFPEGVFQSLMISSKQVSTVIRNPIIKAVTLTGSETAGKKVASLAGKYLKKSVLELGGSDPFIVLSDANISNAVEKAVTARMLCCGQSCIAAKRFIVHESVEENFTQQLIERLKSFSFGNPIDEKTNHSPLARIDLVDDLKLQVEKSISKGAEKIYQQSNGIPANTQTIAQETPLQTRGNFFPITVLRNVKPSSPAFKEELFGPVFCITTFKTEKEAIKLANKTKYGLGASIWSKNAKHAHELAEQIEAGNVCVNKIVRSDPRMPFGGIKNSGYGRELGEFGIKEFVNVKAVS